HHDSSDYEEDEDDAESEDEEGQSKNPDAAEETGDAAAATGSAAKRAKSGSAERPNSLDKSIKEFFGVHKLPVFKNVPSNMSLRKSGIPLSHKDSPNAVNGIMYSFGVLAFKLLDHRVPVISQMFNSNEDIDWMGVKIALG